MATMEVITLKEGSNPLFKLILDAFEENFKISPERVCSVPGRVNLIGEHIDYCGYSVLPMALEQKIDVAFRSVSNSNTLRLKNVNPNFDAVEVELDGISIDKASCHWSNYFLSGFLGVLEVAKEKKIQLSSGIEALVSGSIPPSAGLSSSSALVCSGAIVANHLFQVGLNRSELASLCAKSERFVGTEGGGMDQAIAMMAEKGYAKLIDFNPLRTTDVCLPAGAVFVVLNSLVEANKAAFESFNHRVVEGRIGTMLLAKACDTQEYRRPAELQKALGKTLEEMAALVNELLHDEAYHKDEICRILGMSQNDLENEVLTANTRHIVTFKCKQRLLHVFSEAARVHDFKKVCDSPDENSLIRLGQLMNASHASCRDLYDCSHSQLDKLVEIVSTVAYGARLTGAGWGGCAVALVPASKVQEVLSLARLEFYEKLGREIHYEKVMFVTAPGAGASLYAFNS